MLQILVISLFHDATQKYLKLRYFNQLSVLNTSQCLTYFFNVFPYTSAENQSLLLECTIQSLEFLRNQSIPLQDIIIHIIDWTDSRKLVHPPIKDISNLNEAPRLHDIFLQRILSDVNEEITVKSVGACILGMQLTTHSLNNLETLKGLCTEASIKNKISKYSHASSKLIQGL